MKYLIVSEGNSIDSYVSPNFTRASYFILFDDVDKSAEAVANKEGTDLVQVINEAAKSGVRTLICEDIGSGAFMAAEQNHVQVGVAPHITGSKAVELASKHQLAIAKSPTIRRETR